MGTKNMIDLAETTDALPSYVATDEGMAAVVALKVSVEPFETVGVSNAIGEPSFGASEPDRVFAKLPSLTLSE